MNPCRYTFILCLLFLSISLFSQESKVYSCENGTVSFTSNAPLEMIQAESEELKGIIDTHKRTFAFSLVVRSFLGFNSPLQREHFNENYLESEHTPKASFIGKIIEPVDISAPGTYTIRAKGILSIHGVEQERIIRSKVVSTQQEGLQIESSFTVLLDDHDIRVPKVVNQKISQEIVVRVQAQFLTP